MHHFAGERVVLDLLHQGQAFGLGVLVHRQIDQQVLRGRVMDEILEGLAIHFEVLRFGFAAVDDGRNPAPLAKLLGSASAAQRARIRGQWYRFHVLKSASARRTSVNWSARP